MCWKAIYATERLSVVKPHFTSHGRLQDRGLAWPRDASVQDRRGIRRLPGTMMCNLFLMS